MRRVNAKAFMGCKNLQYFDIPTSVRIINSEAFRECKKLKVMDLSKCKLLYTQIFEHY